MKTFLLIFILMLAGCAAQANQSKDAANWQDSQESEFNARAADAFDAIDRIQILSSEVTFNREYDEARSLATNLRRSAKNADEKNAASALIFFMTVKSGCHAFGDTKCAKLSDARNVAIKSAHIQP